MPGSMPDVNPPLGAKLRDFGDISQVEGTESVLWYFLRSSTGLLLDHPKPLAHLPIHTGSQKIEIEKSIIKIRAFI